MDLRSVRCFVLGIALVLVVGCLPDAPHDNPRDPLNPDARGGLTGTVKGVTNITLSGARVEVLGSGLVGIVDTSGMYFIDGILPGDYSVVASIAGYTSDTGEVEIIPGAVDSLNFTLDGIPVVRWASVLSVHKSYYSGDEGVWIELSAGVMDPDLWVDIDSVWVEVRDSVLVLTQDSVVSSWDVVYGGVIANSFGGDPLVVLVGEDFSFCVEDKIGVRETPVRETLVRIIADVPVPVYPLTGDTVSFPCTFSWEKFTVDFSFEYEFAIWSVEEGVDLAMGERYEVTEIPSSQDSLTVEVELSPGTYYWSIAVVDSVGNRSERVEKIEVK